ncbi:hypothetical protein NKH77_07260 [Streptomyces sp. M19]
MSDPPCLLGRMTPIAEHLAVIDELRAACAVRTWRSCALARTCGTRTRPTGTRRRRSSPPNWTRWRTCCPYGGANRRPSTWPDIWSARRRANRYGRRWTRSAATSPSCTPGRWTAAGSRWGGLGRPDLPPRLVVALADRDPG